MTRSVPYTSVIMIRAKPPLNEVAATIEDARRLEAPVLLFFHAAAVEQLHDASSPWGELFGDPSIDIAYCSAAWQRRGFGEPPAGVEASTLVRFWDALWRSWQLRFPGEHAPIRVRIESPRDLQDWSDCLEVLLAAATLDLPLEVEFSAPAWASLCGHVASRTAWQQLLDFELAHLRVRATPPTSDPKDAGVEFLDSPALDPSEPATTERARVLDL